MKKYEYMINYFFDNGTGNGNGRFFIKIDKLISCQEDVEELDKVIKEYNGFNNVVVTDFKLLRVFDE